MALLPPGPYLLEVVSVKEEKTTVAGHRGRAIQLQLLGTTYRDIWWFVTDAYGANWVWQDVVDSFDLVPKMLGRVFLFMVFIDSRGGLIDSRGGIDNRCRNRITTPLAEVIR